MLLVCTDHSFRLNAETLLDASVWNHPDECSKAKNGLSYCKDDDVRKRKSEANGESFHASSKTDDVANPTHCVDEFLPVTTINFTAQ